MKKRLTYKSYKRVTGRIRTLRILVLYLYGTSSFHNQRLKLTTNLPCTSQVGQRSSCSQSTQIAFLDKSNLNLPGTSQVG